MLEEEIKANKIYTIIIIIVISFIFGAVILFCYLDYLDDKPYMMSDDEICKSMNYNKATDRKVYNMHHYFIECDFEYIFDVYKIDKPICLEHDKWGLCIDEEYVPFYNITLI